jgi:hypothetical protein
MKYFARTIIALGFIVALYSGVRCQEKTYNYKLVGAYDATQFKFNADEVGEYIDGFQFSFEGRIAGKKTFLNGTATFERKNDVTMVDPETYPLPTLMGFSIVKRNTDSLRFGARLGHSFSAFEPFVAAQVGFRNSNDVQPRKLERAYYVGSDVNLNRFFIRVAYQFTRVTGNEGIEQGYVFGGGFRF